MKICVIGSYAKALVMTADRIPLLGETLIGYDYRETYGGKGSDMVAMGANELISEEIIEEHIDQIQAADVVLAQLEIPVDIALYALKRAKELGKTTILNPAPAVKLTGRDLSFVDIITPNETEARVTIGEFPDVEMTHREVALKLLETGCGNVIMTLGGDGVDIHNREGSSHVASYQIEVVDSNGAGDSFNAGLTTALAGGADIEKAVAYANAVAGLCTKWETVPSYHTAEEVDAFIRTHSIGQF